MKFNIDAPAEWVAAIRTEAARRDLSVAEFCRMALRAKLPREVREGLPEPLKRGRPKASC